MGSNELGKDRHSITKCERIIRRPSLKLGECRNNRKQLCSEEPPAVLVRNACKQYGSKSNPNTVLVNLNMTVAKGTIYGLLGASGCGKTTLLSCVVGRRKLDSGKIWIFGGEPGTKDGKRIGYMPQELALYSEFTIKETMTYFGWIFGMQTIEIMERLKFLMDLLDSHSHNRFLKNLSSGQQRRVSFGVALMHDPELLILEAHMIGSMRHGNFIAEETPHTLMAMQHCNNLESAFLALSQKQDTSNEVSELNISTSSLGFRNEPDALVYVSQQGSVLGLNFNQSKEVPFTGTFDGSSFGVNGSATAIVTDSSRKNDMNKSTSTGKIRALLHKNFLRIWRDVYVILFCFVSPVLQVSIFYSAIGRDIHGLKLAIANGKVNGTECNFEPGCHFSKLSCRYLSHLNQTFLTEYFSDPESAIEAVKSGQAWGALYFHVNFSAAMDARMALGQSVGEDVLDQSEIQIWLDLSNQQIAAIVNRDLQFTYRDFSQNFLKDCDINPNLGNIPLRFQEPVYAASSFTDFAAPGVILNIVFFLAVALTTSTLIVERVEGLSDRTRVAGVSPGEILLSHIIAQFVVMCGQTTLVLIFTLLVFDITCNGNLFLAIVMILLQSLNGMCFGFVISSTCDTEHTAFAVALGLFYPCLLMSGFIWPLEGMPPMLRTVANVLPLTQATTALRSVLARGWGLYEQEVLLAFVSTLAWIVLFLGTTVVILKFKRV